uniref:Zinc finger, CCHC-type n=1 Tax=Tanacetum cinerariifolium TaxID=118510 RepID=A0A699H8F3_TANCI|nr:zinc finger, CCHC-type [Tanacetum cinerariifolium]
MRASSGSLAKEEDLKLFKYTPEHVRRSAKSKGLKLVIVKVVYVLTIPMSELLEDATVEAIRIMAKWENDDYIYRGHILNGKSDSLFNVYTNVESAKELWDSLESKYMAKDSSSKKFLVSNFNNYKMVDSRPVMEQYNELLRILGQCTPHGLKMDESISVSKKSLRAQDSDNGKGKEVGGPSVNITEEGGKNNITNKTKVKNGQMRKIVVLVLTRNQSWNVESVARLVTSKGIAVVVDAVTWWIDSGATTHVCKDRCWFKTYEPVEDGSVLYMGDDHFAYVHGKGSVSLEFSSGKTITLFNVLYVPKLRKSLVSGPMLNKCGYTQVYESDKYILSKSGVFVGFEYYNNGMFMLKLNKVPDDLDSIYMSSSNVVDSSLWHARLAHVHYKRMLEMSKDDLILAIDENPEKYTTYRGGEYYDPVYFQSVGIIHETTAPYTPQQNGVAEKKNKALKEIVNSMLSYSGLSEGLWGEAMLTACHLLNRVSNKWNKTAPYELWYKKRPNLSFLRVWSCRAVVRLPDSKRKTLDEKSIDCIFVGNVEHSKAYSFEEDHKTYNKAMQSWDVAFWKEAINDEISSIMENNTWDLSDLPPGCKPLGCKWIFKRKMKVDGTIDKFKVRLVIQGFRQNKGIDYFDTYAPVARITIIRLLLALAAIHNLVIYQMNVKTTLLNDCSPMSTPMDPIEKLKPNTGKHVEQLEYSIIGCLMYVMTSTRPDIAYVVGRLSRFTSNPSRQHCKAITRVFKYLRGTKDYGLSHVGYPSVLEGYSNASWINHVEDSTSTSGWVFLLGGALAAAGKEAEWLRNLIQKIPIWPKPIAPISIRCKSAPTMASAYSQIYNGKSRHLGVRHSMVKELIRNCVISIEFVRTQHNLADHLTNGLARDLVEDLKGPPM